MRQEIESGACNGERASCHQHGSAQRAAGRRFLRYAERPASGIPNPRIYLRRINNSMVEGSKRFLQRFPDPRLAAGSWKRSSTSANPDLFALRERCPSSVCRGLVKAPPRTSAQGGSGGRLCISCEFLRLKNHTRGNVAEIPWDAHQSWLSLSTEGGCAIKKKN
jgi:hypothetical protein